MLTESYDLKKLCYAYENLESLIDAKAYKQGGSYYKTILQDFIINDGSKIVEYNYSKGLNYGRKYAKGIQPLKRQLRDFLLCDTNVIDFDLKNAHPCILQYVCDKYNIQTCNLKEYVLNRDEVFEKHFKMEGFAGDDVKRMILTATNMDKTMFTKNAWLKSYQVEINFIKKQLIEHKDFKQIAKDANKVKQNKENMDSSIMNRILCKYESEIIDVISDALSDNGYEVFALMFDGVMFKGDENSSEMMNDLNEFIKTKYADYFELVAKPIKSDVVMCDYEVNLQTLRYGIDSQQTRTQLFMDTYDPIKIIHPVLYGIKTKTGSYEFYKKSDFIDATDHIKYSKNTALYGIIKQPIVKEFLDGEIDESRIKQCIVVEPQDDDTDNFNLWTDWNVNTWRDDVEDDDTEAVEYYKKHLLSLCNGEENIAEAMNLWVAHMFKYPKNKSFVPIFVGKQGAGKDMWIDWITKLIGSEKKFESVKPDKDVWGDFNPMMKSSFLVHLSEFGRKNTQEYVGMIKSITTSGRILINEKNKGQYMVNSYHRFLGASNFNEPIPIEADNRRYMIIMTSSENIGDMEYFKKGHSFTSSERSLKSIYKYIMSFDPPSNLNYHMVDDSEYMRYIKSVSVPVEEEWLRDFIKLKGVVGEDKVYKYKASDLYSEYKRWSKDANKSFSYEQRKFYIQLKALTTQTTKHINGEHGRDGNFYSFNYDNLIKEGVYTFGEAEEAYDSVHGNVIDESNEFDG